jgi:hypothetical protein
MTLEMILKAAPALKIVPEASYDIGTNDREVAEVQTPLMFNCLMTTFRYSLHEVALSPLISRGGRSAYEFR